MLNQTNTSLSKGFLIFTAHDPTRCDLNVQQRLAMATEFTVTVSGSKGNLVLQIKSSFSGEKLNIFVVETHCTKNEIPKR